MLIALKGNFYETVLIIPQLLIITFNLTIIILYSNWPTIMLCNYCTSVILGCIGTGHNGPYWGVGDASFLVLRHPRALQSWSVWVHVHQLSGLVIWADAAELFIAGYVSRVGLAGLLWAWEAISNHYIGLFMMNIWHL